MHNTLITPDALKSAARALRALEAEKTGASLAQTTILNTLARELGLGSDYTGFKAAFDASTGAPQRDLATIISRTVTVRVIWKTPSHVEVFDTDCFDKNAFDGFKVTLQEPAHGLQILDMECQCALHEDPEMARSELLALGNRALSRVEAAADPDMDAPAGVSFLVDGHPECAELCVNFMYYDNDQVATATVPKIAWDLRRKSAPSLSDEEVFLALAAGCEIYPEQHASDIDVQDVMVGMPEIYDDAIAG